MKSTLIEAKTIDEAWFWCLRKLIEAYDESDEGRDEKILDSFGVHSYKIDEGSYAGSRRLEFNHVVIDIEYPQTRPLAPTVPEGVPEPTTDEKIEKYFNRYLLSNLKEENEQYTYGERILESLEEIISKIKRGSGSNQIILQIAKPSDAVLEDPPCLRHIDIRVLKGEIHFIVYFRSWDLWAGLPENLGGIQMLKEYIGERCGLKDGMLIASSKGSHLYSHTIEPAKMRLLL
jgi:thymidylate synthase